ncbi:MAG: type VI secretion system tube protein Hcp [Burkholderia sp.]|uniref:Hcp family type VI secretion system effector n=1 Tax=Burkholderia TaxID=32008 RepID=UPI000D0A6EF2|nr:MULTISPECIES: type VI secretion system tube protein Hcp [Burkholderia]MBY8603871.1 type VI secretion system tube protein Hcp [Burkholderia arboris]MCA3781520.1 type VI secretion system tube protein Hcp [Burkholderia sp.]MCA3784058.1 type VI secretion system tube protein Hcp [Burkholderia sp.]MCA3796145.1 type VI secretion system tube protein Hcp [Burkholderia sp.]MCA3802354.1 type VI secretion system tube protein Hcp [Burkholderia sp.]
MAQDIFLKLTGIRGESRDAFHPDEIDVLAWDWSADQQSNAYTGGKRTVNDLTIEHYVDRASPILMLHCLKGNHIESAVLVVRKAGGIPLEYLRITMDKVLITRINSSANLNMVRPREEVQLSFARIHQEYVVQNAQGGSGGAVAAGYDFKTGKAT